MNAIDTTYNGASLEAVEAIESVKPPWAYWRAFQSTVTATRRGTFPIETYRVYKIVASGLKEPSICPGPLDGTPVATVIFADDGGRVPHDAIERLDRNEYHAGVPTGWQENCNAVHVIRDLLRALGKQDETVIGL